MISFLARVLHGSRRLRGWAELSTTEYLIELAEVVEAHLRRRLSLRHTTAEIFPDAISNAALRNCAQLLLDALQRTPELFCLQLQLHRIGTREPSHAARHIYSGNNFFAPVSFHLHQQLL